MSKKQEPNLSSDNVASKQFFHSSATDGRNPTGIHQTIKFQTRLIENSEFKQRMKTFSGESTKKNITATPEIFRKKKLLNEQLQLDSYLQLISTIVIFFIPTGFNQTSPVLGLSE